MEVEAEFPLNDTEDPRNWPESRKWLILASIVLVDLSVSWQASGFSPGSAAFVKEFNVSSEIGLLGLSLTVLGFALAPLVQAPSSEYLGRSPIYIASYGISLFFLLGTALVHDISGFLILRLLSGLFCSVTIANIGGTISDMWHHKDTGLPMSIFLWAATIGSSTGYFIFAFVAQTKGWRNVFWSLLGICGGFWLFMVLVLKETRHSSILRKKMKIKIAQDGVDELSPTELSLLEHRSARDLFQLALSRPIRFLITEAIITFLALYNAYLYGLSFLFNEAFTLVFGPDGHEFSIIGVGLSFLGIAVGICAGPVTNLWQEIYYKKRTGSSNANIPEARVQLGMVAAVVHPVSLLFFSWTTFPSIHWIVPIIASAFWGWSFYTLILMSYTYTRDSFGIYSASALAALGLLRNLAGAGFPLFSQQLYNAVGKQWAGSILAFLAILLTPIPLILARYGPRLRKRSPFARKYVEGSSSDANHTQSAGSKENTASAG